MKDETRAPTIFSFPFLLASVVGIVFQGVKRWGRIDEIQRLDDNA